MEFIRLDISDMSLHQEAAKQLIHFAKEQRIFYLKPQWAQVKLLL